MRRTEAARRAEADAPDSSPTPSVRSTSWCCLVVLVASLAGPMTADARASTRWLLVGFHTSVGAAFVAAMLAPWRSRRRCAAVGG